MMDAQRYVLISPCRDEALFMRRTIDAVARQTLAPALWVIVDDGSTDDTPAILREAEQALSFLRVVTRPNRGKRAVGPGVIDAFYAGYETIDPKSFDFICKLDLDLDIPAAYFQEIMRRMDENPRIGTCSGKPYYRDEKGALVSEHCGDETSVGMIKFYRRRCFEEIGGFVRQVMWDGIDCHRCRMNGWLACSWDDPALRFEHLRPMGSSQQSIFTGRARHGFGQYFMGTSLSYMTASALFRMKTPPYVLGGLAMLGGYTRSMLRREPRYDDPEFRAFLRRYQWNCLIKGKARATEEIDQQQRQVFYRRLATLGDRALASTLASVGRHAPSDTWTATEPLATVSAAEREDVNADPTTAGS